MEKKFTQIDEKGARSRKSKDGHVVDNYRLPNEEGGHKEIQHGGKVYTFSGKSGTDVRNRNAQARHYVTKTKIDDKKSKYHGQEVEKGIWVNQLGRVIEEDMKKFTEINEDESLNEEVHLVPHGTKGTHYRVVKPAHTLKKGDILNDTEVDDLHDSGFTVKHLKEEAPKKGDKTPGEAYFRSVAEHHESLAALHKEHGQHGMVAQHMASAAHANRTADDHKGCGNP